MARERLLVTNYGRQRDSIVVEQSGFKVRLSEPNFDDSRTDLKVFF